MPTEIISAIISVFGTLGGAFLGVVTSAKLTAYRIEQLEKKVDKHNSVIDRTYHLEAEVEVIENQIDNLKNK